MKSNTKLLFVVLLCLCSLSVMAQLDATDIQRKPNGKVSFARFRTDAGKSIQDAATLLKTILQPGANDELRLTKEITDKLGFTHRVYQQYYKGIKIENAEYLVHARKGIIETINGDFQAVDLSTVQPSLAEAQALDGALKQVNAKKYKWQDAGMQSFIKKNTNNLNATYYPKGELVITKDALQGGKQLLLAWKFTISSLEPLNEQIVYVNAHTGEVIRKTPLMYDANTPCTADTRYSGAQSITGDSYSGGYRLRENRNGVDIFTLNLQHSYDFNSAVDFSNGTTSWSSGSWPDFSTQQEALDAHWGAEKVLDYWQSVHSRNSIDGNGLRLLSYVNYGVNEVNAYWMGGSNSFMVYGNGDGSTINGFTALDICGHEVGHGVTDYAANLAYGYDESGALHEGLSDIWGACVEYHYAPNKQIWRIGEEIFASTYSGIRDMANPNSSQTYEGPHPDTYMGTFWDTWGEPHFNSTVLSHWFYLLSVGGSGTNDISNAFTVNGITIDQAEQIVYRAVSVYFNSSATYSDARNATIQAARDIYGINSCQEKAVVDAWYAVGVGAAYSGGTMSISGDVLVCTSTSNNYTISNVPAGWQIQWEAIPAGYVNINSPNSPSTTITKLIDGMITMKVTVHNPCTNTDMVYSIPNIQVGNPFPTGTAWATSNYGTYNGPLLMSYSFFLPSGQSGTATFNIADSRYSGFSWTPISVPSGTSWFSAGPVNSSINMSVTASGAAYSSKTITVRCTATGSCGPWTQDFSLTAVVRGWGFMVSPNPAASQLTVSSDKEAGSRAAALIYGIRITDQFGVMRKNLSYKSGITSTGITIADLNPGMYLISVFDGKQWNSKPLMIQR
jgi:bacillolysin